MTATRFTKAQITRAIHGAQDAGFEVGTVEITKDGTVRLLPAHEAPRNKPNAVEDYFSDKS